MSPARRSGGDLVIVESPAKAKTIERYLGDDFRVLASFGHVRDLPKWGLGVDLEHDFSPNYVPLTDRKKELEKLTDAARKADTVWLATDLDREGESIAWHIAEHVGLTEDRIRRVTFSEITKSAIEAAFAEPRSLNIDLIDAQQARRIIDRLVGYKLSPLVASKIRRGLTAGRVQSVAVRLVVDREREISAFTAVEYWTLIASLDRTAGPGRVRAELTKIDGEKAVVSTAEEAELHRSSLEEGTFTVANVTRTQRRQNAPPPFTTSTLQQEASRKLGFSPRRTMSAAQSLYEGAALPEGLVGLITYMRTDSLAMSAGAVAEARSVAASRFGADFVPERPNTFRTSSRGAQEAHEAIRPSSFARTPDSVAAHLKPDAARLYELIWRRALASQMAPARFDQVGVDIDSGIYRLHAGARKRVFDGYQALYVEGKDEEDDEEAARLPDLVVGEALDLKSVEAEQHFTQPPPRFSEATLIKALEEHGIGRPSTYAPTMETIRERGYVTVEDRRLKPTEEAYYVTDLLKEHFPEIVDVDFTAKMEDRLDEVAQGRQEWVPIVRAWWEPFAEQVERGKADIPKQVEETDIVCPESGHPMLKRFGRNGWFLGCSGYPECRHTMPLPGEETEAGEQLEGVGETCPQCGEGTLAARRGRFGPFVSCNRYPDCRYIHKPGAGPVETFGVCPQCQVGTVTSKTSRRGTVFYGCDRYPTCDFATSTKPGPEGATLDMARSGGARKPRKAGARKTTRTRRRA